jgi:glycerol-3-phosphate acyltransferase PlsY
VRRAGSGNVGATNVARTAGAIPGLITLVLDVGKGAIPVASAIALGVDETVVSLAAFAAVLGHVFSLFTSLRGGKGVATAAGAFLVLAPAALGIALVAFAIVVAASRRVSLASIGAAAALPIALAAMGDRGPSLLAAVAVAALIAFTHRENVRRLIAGTEPAFGIKSDR